MTRSKFLTNSSIRQNRRTKSSRRKLFVNTRVTTINTRNSRMMNNFLIFINSNINASLFRLNLRTAMSNMIVNNRLSSNFLTKIRRHGILQTGLHLSRRNIIRQSSFRRITTKLSRTASNISRRLLSSTPRQQNRRNTTSAIFRNLTNYLNLIRINTHFIRLNRHLATRFATNFISLTLCFLSHQLNAKSHRNNNVRLTANFSFHPLRSRRFRQERHTLNRRQLKRISFLTLRTRNLTMLHLFKNRLTRLLLALSRLLLRTTSFVIRLLTTTSMRKLFTNDLRQRNFRRIFQRNRQPIVSLNTRTFRARRRQRPVHFNFTSIKRGSHIIRTGRQHTNFSSLPFTGRRLNRSPTFRILSLLRLKQKGHLTITANSLISRHGVNPCRRRRRRTSSTPSNRSRRTQNIFSRHLLSLKRKLPVR